MSSAYSRILGFKFRDAQCAVRDVRLGRWE